jgi:hypothetical protein
MDRLSIRQCAYHLGLGTSSRDRCCHLSSWSGIDGKDAVGYPSAVIVVGGERRSTRGRLRHGSRLCFMPVQPMRTIGITYRQASYSLNRVALNLPNRLWGLTISRDTITVPASSRSIYWRESLHLVSRVASDTIWYGVGWV